MLKCTWEHAPSLAVHMAKVKCCEEPEPDCFQETRSMVCVCWEGGGGGGGGRGSSAELSP